ncbi:response regulator transcription factor [Falsibacillus albus]|uniref:DNA-binding response regulator n=1 Tax=Falsibacillus albus TaxID=2478915 RepID=A0A3L7K2L1_9BACI|nr:response regulator transcription factor [Falsibacillus albus]RLQ97337.1 DNA-binding response regulator [Falsibacillus albus]
MSYRIYLVEDEKHLNSILTSYLKREGWEVASFHNGSDAVEAIPDHPDCWILDIMLPDMDGYQLLKNIKQHHEDVPVIYISARDSDLDRILGLELGGDDYIAKPFLPKELVIRTKKLLQRIYGKNKHALEVSTYGPYVVNELKRTIAYEDEHITLTSKEYDLFLFFYQNIGRAFSRDEILQCVWGSDYFGSDRVVDDLIRRLRKKLPYFQVETIYGYGYRLTDHV